MPAHSIGSGTISFGLVAIPVRLYTAAVSAGVSFHLLHAACGHRIRQQTYCPVDHAVVERGELVKGYEVAKDQYVPVTDAELQALEGAASTVIDIREFVPLPRVDPIYFERTYYLGPAKGGAKAYRLLAQAMATTGRRPRHVRAAGQGAPGPHPPGAARPHAPHHVLRRRSARLQRDRHG